MVLGLAQQYDRLQTWSILMSVTKTETSKPLAATTKGGDHTVQVGWTMAISASIAYSVATPVARGAILSGFDPNALLVGRMVLAVSLLQVLTQVGVFASFASFPFCGRAPRPPPLLFFLSPQPT